MALGYTCPGGGGAEFHALSPSLGSRLRVRYAERLGGWHEASSAFTIPSTEGKAALLTASGLPLPTGKEPSPRGSRAPDRLTVTQGPNQPSNASYHCPGMW